MVIDVFILCQGPTNVRFASYEQTTGKIRFKTRRKAWVMRLAYNEAHNLLITPQQAQLRKLQPCLSNSYGLAHREKFEQECSPCVQKSTVDFAGLRHQKNSQHHGGAKHLLQREHLDRLHNCSWMHGTETFTISSTVRCWMRF